MVRHLFPPQNSPQTPVQSLYRQDQVVIKRSRAGAIHAFALHKKEEIEVEMVGRRLLPGETGKIVGQRGHWLLIEPLNERAPKEQAPPVQAENKIIQMNTESTFEGGPVVYPRSVS